MCSRVYNSCECIYAQSLLKFDTYAHKIAIDHHIKFHEDLSFRDICKTILDFFNHWFSMYLWYFCNYEPQKPSKLDNYWMFVDFFFKTRSQNGPISVKWKHHSKLIFCNIIFWAQNSLDAKFSELKIFFWLKVFGSKIYWTQYALKNGVWLWRWPNLFVFVSSDLPMMVRMMMKRIMRMVMRACKRCSYVVCMIASSDLLMMVKVMMVRIMMMMRIFKNRCCLCCALYWCVHIIVSSDLLSILHYHPVGLASQ